ncbi:hypothetical protein [Sphaerisporangium fuscum]|uniref:hypothetical protein n=1 Tax=Sphaerisporangium fuscum TaxID=2835868 RepID=UPI001BDCE7EC|nr:hypothetical protein [Sphaerisporangium fuscum]
MNHFLARCAPLGQAPSDQLDALYAGAQEGRSFGKTVLQIHRMVSRALEFALRRELITRNVCGMIDASTGEDHEIEPLDREAAREILADTENRRNGTRWSVALALGLRQCEALGLRARQIGRMMATLHSSRFAEPSCFLPSQGRGSRHAFSGCHLRGASLLPSSHGDSAPGGA